MYFLIAATKIHDSSPWLLNKAKSCALLLQCHFISEIPPILKIAVLCSLSETANVRNNLNISEICSKVCEFLWWGSRRVNIEKYLLLG